MKKNPSIKPKNKDIPKNTDCLIKKLCEYCLLDCKRNNKSINPYDSIDTKLFKKNGKNNN